MDKPEALRLANALERQYLHACEPAAAELRRQHGEIKSMQAERMRTERRLLAVEAQRDALLEANEAFSKRQQWWNEKMFTLEQQRDALLEALLEAATSLETVGRLAGKSDYLGDAGERIPTYMGRHDEVREYATSRAGVARAAIKAVEGEKK